MIANAPEVFHTGEVAMQTHAGMAARMHEIGDKVIRDHMPDQHRTFFRTLPTLVVGSVDAQRRPWASMLVGEPGFIADPDDRHLQIEARPDLGDPLGSNLGIGAPLGLLGLEPATRRRNRLNGRVATVEGRGFSVEVDQSFGNCPKYIQARTPHRVEPSAQAVVRLGGRLSEAAATLVSRADTLFIASATPPSRDGTHARSDGVDVSHRGGRPGFVRIDREGLDTVLTFPDFTGNFFFNTLGNLVAHPHAGLLFVDHETGDVLQVTGRAEVVADGRALEAFDGARYLVRVRIDEAVWRPGALPLRWSAPEPAAQLAATGWWVR